MHRTLRSPRGLSRLAHIPRLTSCALFMRKFERIFKISPRVGSTRFAGLARRVRRPPTRRAFRYFFRARSRLRASKDEFAKTKLLTSNIVAEKRWKMKSVLISELPTHPKQKDGGDPILARRAP